MSKRDDIQAEALETAYKFKRCTLSLSMGVGKTLIGLKYIEHFRKDNLNLRVLVVAPKLSIFQSWKDDGIKFGISGANIEFTTYLSLVKLNPHDYDIVVLDECHSLLNNHAIFLALFNGRILGLTGTPPRHANSEKGMLIRVYCPVVYKYSTDLAIDDSILNNYKIIVHTMTLSTKNRSKR
jgi:superfamily II DNA or RNA helicase